MPILRPHLLKVSTQPLRSFSIRHDILPHFYNQYHYHPEVELLYIEKGSGTRFVGDSIQRFQPGDLLLIGSELPHYLRSDDAYFKGDPAFEARALVIHFLPQILGDSFLELQENRFIAQLLTEAKKGLLIRGRTRDIAVKQMRYMHKGRNMNYVLQLYQLLDFLSDKTEMTALSSRNMEGIGKDGEADRLNRIYKFAANNFRRKVSIDEAAELANLSRHSFCRYFRAKTGKTFTQFINEIRVEYACKLLKERDMPVKMVCAQSGFNNFTSFNNVFKKVNGRTPMQFARAFE